MCFFISNEANHICGFLFPINNYNTIKKQCKGENMKFIHIADVHFDIPFTRLEGRNLSEMRRLEQRNAFRKVIEKYILYQEITIHI